ncbi:hypothetical protein IWQ49_001951 [Labrenzia sp. EL_126]|nr:hypothetical protein [Labrenzia sp. EL_126]
MNDPELWNRIHSCHPDVVEADLPFSKRLARDNNWTHEYALTVIIEYLRFAYLSRMKAGMVTPSDEVDQAWHLHLTYTRHYWGPFKDALGGPLHHMPTKGGADQSAFFRDAYQKTLELYQSEFGNPPPKDIWPPAEIRFGRAPHFMRINSKDVWLLQKPRLPYSVLLTCQRLTNIPARVYGALISLFALLFGTGLAFAHGQPAGDTLLEKLRNMVWHWASEHTLWFILGVVVIVLLCRAIFIKATGSSSGCGAGCGGGDSGGGSGCGGCGD